MYQVRVVGMLVTVQRGGCSFSMKTLAAQRAGASGVIIVNTAEETLRVMADPGDVDKAVIPTIMCASIVGRGNPHARGDHLKCNNNETMYTRPAVLVFMPIGLDSVKGRGSFHARTIARPNDDDPPESFIQLCLLCLYGSSVDEGLGFALLRVSLSHIMHVFTSSNVVNLLSTRGLRPPVDISIEEPDAIIVFSPLRVVCSTLQAWMRFRDYLLRAVETFSTAAPKRKR